ncbi:MAG TPA: hypothetical protein P5534_03775 [Candidatus Paceibacterota bacterium]|nr:hypothetical protein [Candidatus Paceibacterota bacterium]
MTEPCSAYVTSPLDHPRWGRVETLIQPPSGAAWPALATGRFRYVLAANGRFVQARTPCIEARVLLAPLPAGPRSLRPGGG